MLFRHNSKNIIKMQALKSFYAVFPMFTRSTHYDY